MSTVPKSQKSSFYHSLGPFPLPIFWHAGALKLRGTLNIDWVALTGNIVICEFMLVHSKYCWKKMPWKTIGINQSLHWGGRVLPFPNSCQQLCENQKNVLWRRSSENGNTPTHSQNCQETRQVVFKFTGVLEPQQWLPGWLIVSILVVPLHYKNIDSCWLRHFVSESVLISLWAAAQRIKIVIKEIWVCFSSSPLGKVSDCF